MLTGKLPASTAVDGPDHDDTAPDDASEEDHPADCDDAFHGGLELAWETLQDERDLQVQPVSGRDDASRGRSRRRKTTEPPLRSTEPTPLRRSGRTTCAITRTSMQMNANRAMRSTDPPEPSEECLHWPTFARRATRRQCANGCAPGREAHRKRRGAPASRSPRVRSYLLADDLLQQALHLGRPLLGRRSDRWPGGRRR